MPEFTKTMQKKEGLHGHPATSFSYAARIINGVVQDTHKVKKVKARSIHKLLTPGFFVGSVLSILADTIDAGTVFRPWQILNETRY